MGGLRTAESLRRSGYQGPITVLGDEPHLPYNRPPLSKEILAKSVSHQAVAFPLRAGVADVDWLLGARAESAELAARTVRTADGRELTYSALVIATGLRSHRLNLGPPTLRGRHALRTLDDALALRAELVPGAAVVIVGGGFLGCELAATARKLGCEVTVVARQPLPLLDPLGRDLAHQLMTRHQREGVRFRCGTTVRSILGADSVTAVELDTGEVLPADLLVEAVGSRYNTAWLHGNDVDLAEGVRTDSALRVLRTGGSPWLDVHAVGDVARFPHGRYGGLVRAVPHWNIPTETARRAGRVIAARLGGDPAEYERAVAEPFSPVPSFWSDQYDLHLLAFGLLDLADDIRLLEGDPAGECVYGYYRGDAMVGVCGIGCRSVVQGFRNAVGTSPGVP